MKSKLFFIMLLLGLGLVVGCESEVRDKYQVVSDVLVVLTEYDYEEAKTSEDYFAEFNHNIQGLLTDEAYQEIVNGGMPGHAIKTMMDHESTISIESFDIEPEWAEENKVGYYVTLQAVIQNEDKILYTPSYRISLQKIDDEWIVYQLKKIN